MAWVAWVVLAALIGSVGMYRKRHMRAEMAFAILFGLIAMQGVKSLFDPQNWWVASFLVWVLVASCITISQHRFRKDVAAVVLLLISSAICYAAGSIIGAEFGPGSLPLQAADAFGALALIIIGGPVFVGFIRDFYYSTGGLACRLQVGIHGCSVGEGKTG